MIGCSEPNPERTLLQHLQWAFMQLSLHHANTHKNSSVHVWWIIVLDCHWLAKSPMRSRIDPSFAPRLHSIKQKPTQYSVTWLFHTRFNIYNRTASFVSFTNTTRERETDVWLGNAPRSSPWRYASLQTRASRVLVLNPFTSGILYFFWTPVRDYFQWKFGKKF